MSYGLVSHLNSSRRNKETQRNRAKEWYNKNKDRAMALRKASDRKRLSMGSSVCKILENHHLELRDDPERLTTEFLQSLIGVKCK